MIRSMHMCAVFNKGTYFAMSSSCNGIVRNLLPACDVIEDDSVGCHDGGVDSGRKKLNRISTGVNQCDLVTSDFVMPGSRD